MSIDINSIKNENLKSIALKADTDKNNKLEGKEIELFDSYLSQDSKFADYRAVLGLDIATSEAKTKDVDMIAKYVKKKELKEELDKKQKEYKELKNQKDETRYNIIGGIGYAGGIAGVLSIPVIFGTEGLLTTALSVAAGGLVGLAAGTAIGYGMYKYKQNKDAKNNEGVDVKMMQLENEIKQLQAEIQKI